MLEFLTEAMKNPVFAGMMAAGITGGGMLAVKSVFPYIMKLLREQFCTSLVVYNDEHFYYKLQVFLSRHDYSKKARSTSVTEWWHRKEDTWTWGLSPGTGWHFFWHKGNFYIAYRHIDPAPATGAGGNAFGPRRGETFYFYTLGRDQKAMRALLEEVHGIYNDKETIPIYIWSGNDYQLAQHREKRSLDTIFIPEEQKARLVDDMQRFLNSRELYRRRGTPYRRGYMLEGPPGTGKSSLIFALAGHFDKPVYIVNPATMNDDNTLQRAFNEIRSNGILIIEDIDSIDVTEQRKDVKEKKDEKDEKKSSITLSGLLNGIDGVIARDGRMLFITSNHANNLDAALVRPGRVDRREYLGLMELPEALKMFDCFYPDLDRDVFERWIAPQLPMSPANVQNILLGYDEPTVKSELVKSELASPKLQQVV